MQVAPPRHSLLDSPNPTYSLTVGPRRRRIRMTKHATQVAALAALLLLVQSSAAFAIAFPHTQHQVFPTDTSNISTVNRNPAGLPFVPKGLHLNLTTFVVNLDQGATATEKTGAQFAGKKYSANLLGPVPYLYAGYVGDEWSVVVYNSMEIGNPDAVSFEPALLDMRSAGLGFVEADLEVISTVFTYNVAVGWRINDQLGVAVVGRVGTRWEQAEVTVPSPYGDSYGKAKARGHALGGSFGIGYQPTDRWFFSANVTTALRINPYVSLSTLDKKSGPAADLASGIALSTVNRPTEIPWTTSAGARYALTPGWMLRLGVNVEFWGETFDETKQNSISGQIGTSVDATESLTLHTGFNYNTSIIDKDKDPGISYGGDLLGFTVGAGYEVAKGHKLDAGVMLNVRFQDDTEDLGFVDGYQNILVSSLSYTVTL